MVQWLRLCTSKERGLCWTPGRGTRSHDLKPRVHMPQIKSPHVQQLRSGTAKLISKYKWILFYFIYLFSPAQGLHCCDRAFSSCGKWGLLSSFGVHVSHGSDFSYGWAQVLGLMSVAARKHVESSWTRNGTHVSYIFRQILNHWTTREILK